MGLGGNDCGVQSTVRTLRPAPPCVDAVVVVLLLEA
jgi:hypothetical protein